MACSGAAGNEEVSALSPAGLKQVALTVRSGSKTHHFTVEIAETDQQQQYGLMNRQNLAPDRGMIFPFVGPNRQASFWMKDTYIPLDIIFVRADGTIANIAVNTTPLSLESVYSDGDVAAVLEIAGGRSAELGIRAGDTVAW